MTSFWGSGTARLPGDVAKPAVETCYSPAKTLADNGTTSANGARTLPQVIEVGLLTGGFDRPYAFGLAMALASRDVYLDVIGSDEVDSPEMHATPNLHFLNFRGEQQINATLAQRVARVLLFYARQIRYAAVASPKIFHILWNNKFQYFDRTVLMLYYKTMGKRIALTVHNVNAGIRDSNDSLLNRLTLRMQYRLSDHIFVHTEKMKRELLQDFGVRERAVSVIPFGINNSVPDTSLTYAEARQRLGIGESDKTILFFGAIRPYKGLEYLVAAFQEIATTAATYRLIIAGEPKKGSEQYLDSIQRTINGNFGSRQIIQKFQFIPDTEAELYFKAADVLALPYTHVFQSGVLFLAYSFGLPVIASDVGNFREDIIEGRTGFLCRPRDPADLAAAIKKYFASDLFKDLHNRRQEIRDYAHAHHSWDVVGEVTRQVYADLLGREES